MHIIVLPIALAFTAGISIVIQQALNANLRTALDSAVWSGFTSYLVGLLCMAVLVIALREPIPSAGAMSRIPWWAWSGGMFGAIFIAFAIYLVPVLRGDLHLASDRRPDDRVDHLRPFRLAGTGATHDRPAAPDRRGLADRRCGADPALK